MWQSDNVPTQIAKHSSAVKGLAWAEMGGDSVPAGNVADWMCFGLRCPLQHMCLRGSTLTNWPATEAMATGPEGVLGCQGYTGYTPPCASRNAWPYHSGHCAQSREQRKSKHGLRWLNGRWGTPPDQVIKHASPREAELVALELHAGDCRCIGARKLPRSQAHGRPITNLGRITPVSILQL